MTEELRQIAEGFRDVGGGVSEDEAEGILECSLRKMEVCGIKDRSGYLPLLFRDEVKNYIIRRGINAITALRRMGVEVSV